MFPRCHHPRLILAVLALLGGAVRASAELAASSPFLPPQGQMAAPTSAAPLEFRGISTEGENTRFSIFDPTKKSGTWVALNDSSNEFTVKKYDADSDTVTVDYQGRSLTLAMRTPKVASLGNAMAPPPAPMPIPGPMQVNPVTRNVLAVPTPASEAARLADWQAEIQRRRDVRAQQTTATPAAPAVAQPAPAVPPPRPQQRRQ